jgi:hypothetical protein
MFQKHFVLWSPRLLGVAISVFLGLFALDAFEPGKPPARAFTDVALHLVPALGVLAIVVLSWDRPWLGGAAFVLLAIAYAGAARFRPDWVLVISGPLLLVGLLFLWSWRYQRPLNAG